MADARGTDIVDRWQTLRAERALWEQGWQTIADLIRPLRNDVLARPPTGANRHGRQYDATAAHAAENLAAGYWSMMTNAANQWFDLDHDDEAVRRDRSARLWLEAARRKMQAAQQANGMLFYRAAMTLLSDFAPFGTAALYLDDLPELGLRWAPRLLSECVFANNRLDLVDTCIRRWPWTARQAVQQWGDAAPAKVREAAEKRPDQKFTFLHAVHPRADRKRDGRRGPDKPVASVYVFEDDRTVISEGGYDEFPFAVPRYATAAGDVYGYGPGHIALADVKMLNLMVRTDLVGLQKQVDPPLLAADEDWGPGGLRTGPGAVIPGAIDHRTGRALVQPLPTGARVELGLQQEEQIRARIREVFHWSLLILVQQPNMTATEAMQRQEEQIRLMGPRLGRLQSEFLEPILARQFALQLRRGDFERVPDSIARRPDGLKIRFLSPLARAQRVAEANGLLWALDAARSVAEMKPEILDAIDADRVLRLLWEARGAPATALLDQGQVDALRRERAQQQDTAQAAAAAPGVAGAMRDLAEVAA